MNFWINENLITESLSSVVYHFASMQRLLKMAKENRFYLTSAVATPSDMKVNRERLYYMSTTRNKSVRSGFGTKFSSNGVRIQLNGDKLNQKYKSFPVDYWGDSMGKQSYYRDNKDFKTRQQHIDNEMEDRLVSNDQTIENFSRYIERIDIILDSESEYYEQYVYYAFSILMTSYGRFCNFYDNINDFERQSENTINKWILDNGMNYKLEYDFRDRGKSSVGMFLSYAIPIIIQDGSDYKNYAKDAAALLKKYNLGKYMGSGILKDITQRWGRPESYIDNISIEMRNVSKENTQDGLNAMKLWTDWMQEHGLKNLYDVVKYLKGRTKNGNERLSIDYGKSINVVRFADFIIPEPDKTSFWSIYPYKEDFINDVFRYGVHNSKSDDSFYKFLQHLAKNNPSVTYIKNMLNKLQIDDEKIFNMFGCDFKDETVKWNDIYSDVYRLPEYPNLGKDDDKNYEAKAKYFLKDTANESGKTKKILFSESFLTYLSKYER